MKRKRPAVHALLVCAICTPTLAAGLFSAGWRDDFGSLEPWEAKLSWLSNRCPDAAAQTDGHVACFTVPEAGRGMKWARDIAPVWIAEQRYLVVRYRALGLDTKRDDYFLFIDDRGRRETRPILLSDLVCDGQWRTVGVDLAAVAESDSVKAIAIQVQAAAAPARVWVDFIQFADRVPTGCQELRARAEPELAPDLWLDLGQANWAAEPSWLSNPVPRGSHRVSRVGEVTTFHADAAYRGMKWCWFFDDVGLVGRRYACLRYRASGSLPRSDYAVCVMGSQAADGKSYTCLIPAQRLHHDGRWHTLTLAMKDVAALFPKIKGMAVQVQCGSTGKGRLEVEKLGFVNAVQPERADRLFQSAPVDAFGSGHFEPVGLGNTGADLSEALAALNVVAWPYGQTVLSDRVPFALPKRDEPVPAAGLRETRSLSIDVRGKCSQVFLLALAVIRGKEEEVYLRDGPCTAISQIDRFRVRLEYDDGFSEECFPYNATLREFKIVDGAQVLCAFVDSSKVLARVVVMDHTDRAGFAIVGVTRRTAAPLFPDAAEDWPAMRIRMPSAKIKPAPPRAERHGTLARMHSSPMSLDLQWSPTPKISQLTNWASGDQCFTDDRAESLYQVTLDGKPLPTEGAAALRAAKYEQIDERSFRATYESSADSKVRLVLTAAARPSGEVVFDARVENLSPKPLRIGLTGPKLGYFTLGDDLASNYYVFPKRGWHFHNRPTFARSRYGGMFPLQFMAAFNPAAGSSLCLRTEDTAGVMRDYLLEKNEKGMMLWLNYPEREVTSGNSLVAARTVIAATGGDWHESFDRYKEWVKTWYKPMGPRPKWWRETFNFRQRFLRTWGPLYDVKTGTFHLEDALAEAAEHFGGMEYMHIFDWGYCGKYGRIYGRTGDYDPYEYLNGGRAAFRAAIEGVQKRGVPVGLYIEGYLLQEKGKLGQAHGKQWQLVNRREQPVYWPDSSEMMICSFVPAWREVQASTYAAKVRELDVDGMYLDQFGFAGPSKDCWSPDHGHPVPGYCMLGERGLSTLVRERISAAKPGVVLYSEETPCDVNSQVQDGSFTYHMTSCRWSKPLAPIHPVRFAIPSFKTFEILVCDRPTGTWSEGVKWVFFNGEGIWLEGQATRWFRPHTLAAIRKCHRILREHRDAFTSEDVTPLVPTETGGLYANRFAAGSKVVYTLYNARHRTTRGPALALRPRPGARYTDAWNGRPIKPTRTRGRDVLHLTLGPRDVGCVVCAW